MIIRKGDESENMKKTLLAGILAFVVMFSLGSFNAEAAYGSWTSVKQGGSSCKVRIWTDYTSYSASATTVDYKIYNNGSCSNLKYESSLEVYVAGGSVALSGYHTGNFSNSSPVKRFSLSPLKNYNLNPLGGAVMAHLYTSSKSNSTLVDSAHLTLHH